MTPERDFNAFYEGEVLPVLQEMDAKRRGAVRKLGCGLLITFGVASAVALFGLSAGSPAPALFALIAGLVVAVIVAIVSTKGYTQEFKTRVVGAACRFLDPSLAYNPKGGITKAEFKESGLFRTGIDRYHCEDLVQGRVGATDIRFSEVHAEYRTQDSKGRSSYHTIFKGLFVIADFHKHFRTRTWVLPDIAEKGFGSWLGQKLQGAAAALRPGQLIKLEDPEFEHEFVVYADDQVEARYILSPGMMERMVALRRRAGQSVHFGFVGSNVHIAITSKRNMFEPRLFGSVVDRVLVEQYVRDLEFALGIVDDLNLNTRIWSKE